MVAQAVGTAANVVCKAALVQVAGMAAQVVGTAAQVVGTAEQVVGTAEQAVGTVLLEADKHRVIESLLVAEVHHNMHLLVERAPAREALRTTNNAALDRHS